MLVRLYIIHIGIWNMNCSRIENRRTNIIIENGLLLCCVMLSETISRCLV